METGAFGGRSLAPRSAALRHVGAGAIYGIKARGSATVENRTGAAKYDRWPKVDFVRMEHAPYRFVVDPDPARPVRSAETDPARAARLMRLDRPYACRLVALHGLNAAKDVVFDARKLRLGGTMVFDEVDWQTTASARW